MDGVDESAQDGEFEFEFDAVNGALEGDLDGIVTGVLETEEDEIHDEHGDVDSDELIHDLPLVGVGAESKQLDRFGDVQSRDYDFLDGEAGHLDLFHDVIPVNEDIVSVGDVGSVGEDGGRDVKEEEVGENHIQHTPEDTLIPQNKMQTGVQDERLAGDHGPPADGQDGDGEDRMGVGEELQQEAQRIRKHADAG